MQKNDALNCPLELFVSILFFMNFHAFFAFTLILFIGFVHALNAFKICGQRFINTLATLIQVQIVVYRFVAAPGDAKHDQNHQQFTHG
jgi:hypothetical protein